MKILVLATLLSIAVSVVEASERVLYEEVTYNKPNLREETEVYLGDRMLEQQVGAWKECITPKQTYTRKQMAHSSIYKGGEPICKDRIGSKDYSPTYDVTPTLPGNRNVRWREKGNKSSLCACMGGCAYCVKNLPKDAVESGETFIFRPNSFQQAIEYAGKSGNNLKFAYSEFTDGFSRQSFTREFQVDLTEGNVAAYKGAIIEIIEATNVTIKYKVIRNFAGK